MSMESMNNGELQGRELAMFNSFSEKNPGVTQADFIELRDIAKNAHSTGAKSFFAVRGILMEEKPEAEELSEIKDNRLQE